MAAQLRDLEVGRVEMEKEERKDGRKEGRRREAPWSMPSATHIDFRHPQRLLLAHEKIKQAHRSPLTLKRYDDDGQ